MLKELDRPENANTQQYATVKPTADSATLRPQINHGKSVQKKATTAVATQKRERFLSVTKMSATPQEGKIFLKER